MNTLLFVVKEGGHREDVVKKIEQVGFQVHSCEPQLGKTLEEMKKLKPNVVLIDFAGNPGESKAIGQVGKELFQELRGTPLYLVDVDNRKKELIKASIGGGKFVEEKHLYKIIKTFVSSDTTTPSETAPKKENQTPPLEKVQKLEKVEKGKKVEKTAKEAEKTTKASEPEKTKEAPAKKTVSTQKEEPKKDKKDEAAPKKKTGDSVEKKTTPPKKGKK